MIGHSFNRISMKNWFFFHHSRNSKGFFRKSGYSNSFLTKYEEIPKHFVRKQWHQEIVRYTSLKMRKNQLSSAILREKNLRELLNTVKTTQKTSKFISLCKFQSKISKNSFKVQIKIQNFLLQIEIKLSKSVSAGNGINSNPIFFNSSQIKNSWWRTQKSNSYFAKSLKQNYRYFSLNLET